ncbi:MAG: glycosyltransferase family 39 protein [Acidobacteriota bacterium]|nr:glycosyltransferase family 39 protein [Acidobacteriota bacterium]
MSRDSSAGAGSTGVFAVALILSALKLLLHFVTNGGYGYFRDELYYLACAERLDWGYVDQAPFIAWVARASRALLGESLPALRFFPAVAGALTVFVTGMLARELGGGRFAALLACAAVVVAPYFLGIHTLLTMNAFEPLFWLVGAYLVARVCKTGDARLWLWFGAVAGLGLLNKHSTLVYGFGVAAGLLLSPARKFFLSRWLWLGGAAALLIFLPHLLWQIGHGWPIVEVLRNADRNQNVEFSLAGFLAGQVVLLHPLTLPVWLAGLYFYLFARGGRPFRALGYAYLVMLFVMILARAKVYYLMPFYPVLFAAGGVALEGLTARRALRWLRPVTVGLLVAGGALTAPLVLPVLPIETYVRYQERLGLEPPRAEKSHTGKLPQHFADMFGWEEMTDVVARVYHSLPAEERGRCAIFTSNYGEAGAIDFFGPRRGLPKAISGHQNYFLWGPRDYTGECVITVGEELEGVQKAFDWIEHAATFTHPHVIPHENNTHVFVCRRPKRPLKEIWPGEKCFSC